MCALNDVYAWNYIDTRVLNTSIKPVDQFIQKTTVNFTACSLRSIVSVAVLLNMHVENTIKIINWKMENSRTWMC